MKTRIFTALLCLSASVWGQATTAASPDTGDPNRPVAVLNGRKLTAAEANAILANVPQRQGVDRQNALQTVGMLELVAQQAVKEGLDKQSPYRERIEFFRMDQLTQAWVQHLQRRPLFSEEQRKYYDENKDLFTQVKFRKVYLPFVTSQLATVGSTTMTEEQAKAKATDLVRQARSGADFAALAKEHSQDQTDREKRGQEEVLSRRLAQSQGTPAELMQPLFAATAGQVTDPVRLPNGYFIFQVVESGLVPFEKVSDDIIRNIRQQQLQKFADETRKQVKLEVLDPSFFQAATPTTSPAPAAPAPRP